jgi:hypothetical protein
MMSDDFEVTATRSAGPDGAVIIFIDGDFDAVGLRILLNSDEVFVSKRYEVDRDTSRPARTARLTFTLDDIDYGPTCPTTKVDGSGLVGCGSANVQLVGPNLYRCREKTCGISFLGSEDG